MYEIFQKLLNEKGVKTSDVARATGISNMTFSDWKRGKCVPKIDKLQKIADYFGVTVEYIMTGKNSETQLSKHDERFVLAHEIGHSVLHPNACTPFLKSHTLISINKMELEANKFATELLITDEIILENWQMTTEQLVNLLGYSKELIELRLK